MPILTSYYHSLIKENIAMGLLRLVPVVLLIIIQLYKVKVEAVNLPTLPNNRLFEGEARNLPGRHAEPQCGQIKHVSAKIGARLTVAQALTPSNFKRYAFSSGPLSSYQTPKISGNAGTFKFTTVTSSKTMYALTVDPAGDLAYWLPQGGAIEVPQHPKSHEPKYVFSADFSGCSWTVTPMNNGKMILRHITGGQEGPQFNRLSPAQKGGDTTYAMQYVDYAYDTNLVPVLHNRRAFAYMHYTGRSWQFHFQRQTCVATPGTSEFKNGLLSGMKLTDNTARDQISSVKTYSIP